MDRDRGRSVAGGERDIEDGPAQWRHNSYPHLRPVDTYNLAILVFRLYFLRRINSRTHFAPIRANCASFFRGPVVTIQLAEGNERSVFIDNFIALCCVSACVPNYEILVILYI